MQRNINCAQWFICAVAFVSLFTFAWRKYDEWRDYRWYEDRIDSFGKDTVQPLDVPRERIVTTANLSGRWLLHGHRSGSARMTFEPMESGNASEYRVAFDTHACTSNYSADRTAHFLDGNVFLNRPVADSRGFAYQTLCCVHVGRTKVLVPTARTEATQGLLEAIRRAEDDNEWRVLESLVYVYEGP